ncbi:MAG: hypothetical protein ACREE9_21055 [Stellaceae bacterium]
MLGSLPKLFDKNFVIGFYLPTLLALIATAWAFPNLTVLDSVRSLSVSEKKLEDITYLAVIVWVIAVLMMSTNYTQYRLLEGYLPPVSWLIVLRRWHRWRFHRLACQYDALTSDWEKAGKGFPQRKQDRASKMKKRLVTYYPRKDKEVLPTRFGNTILAFERYPFEVYGVDSVPVWPRLASVIPTEFAGLLDDAKAQVDCFVTVTSLASLIVLASLAGVVYDAHWLHLPSWNSQLLHGLRVFFGPDGLRHIVIAGIGLVTAALAYWQATACALAWGMLVKSAFDCYLPALIKQLGFAWPLRDSERREFWTELNALILYERPMTADRWALAIELAPTQEPTQSKQTKPESTEEDSPSDSGARCGPASRSPCRD